jgi:hypothetical protein
MKITSTFMAILTVCAVLTFNACDVNNNSKDKTKELLMLGSTSSGGVTTYAIGDTGPSGVGKVFYVTDGGVHGLEAAPSGWYVSTAPNDPTAEWIYGTYQSTSIGTTGTAIGTGLSNSITIVTDNDNLSGTSAAGLCRAYTGGGKADWFLPSVDELNQLYLQKTVVGDFASNTYWSSSEYTAAYACIQGFYKGIQSYDSKFGAYYVRAVRAF